jgi:hypothetical protein
MTTDTNKPGSPTIPATIAALDGVTRRYRQVTAVDDLSLQIRSGETVALLGPNGAGKTTTVELLLGLATPDRGVVRLFGGPPAAAVAAGRVGAMLQDAGLPQGARVAELVGLVRSLYPDPHSVAEVLRLADLEDVAARQVQRLSGGSASGCGWPWPWPATPSCWSLTSRPPRWTWTPAAPSGSGCAAMCRRAARCCSPPTGWRRPTRSPTAWSSSPAAACWLTAPPTK